MRRHDLDFLRVFVFALLIFYHVGMVFVPWDFHLKNNVIYDWICYPMWFVNQWRLPILFLISGMGTYFALQKRTGKQFAIERIKRLFIPLLFGMMFIVPPQVYVERLYTNQFTGSYFNYLQDKAFIGGYPEGNISWHHLWFLPYLLMFSLVLIPIFLYLNNHPDCRFISYIKHIVKNPFRLYVFIIPLTIVRILLEPDFPVTHALIDDWYTISNYLMFFIFGFLLIIVKESFWYTVEKYRKHFLVAGILSFSIMIIIPYNHEHLFIRYIIESLLKCLNLWSWILVLFGFASKYYNRETNILRYANEAVYPFYILHQTVMMVITYYVIDLEWTLGIKASILIVGTFVITWMIYELLIRKWRYVRPLWGLKNN